ncbi:transglycosylase domain-containing protein [Marivirga sp. S37H4]|uniref:Transglycosylase domain-containing protein n=1 Tax=Marivirga aurantiaca TaxID=2802615 RepID=A0A935C6D5_9BACT|nr:transglycosylase domain-containing protein [Marivirga aurantiaca]MBK6264309.1 transglycosylase domain-containing protein [Marivirga aurantiaca]
MERKKNQRLKNTIFKYLALTALCLFLLTIGFLWSIKAGLFGPLPDHESLAKVHNPQATRIVDETNENLGYLYRFYRSNVTYDDLPQHLIDALITTEDARFYEHSGVDYRSLGRVLFKTVLLQDRSAGGGSTITQQLVKNLYPRDYDNKFEILVIKIKEIFIAQKLEKIYSKNDILTLYLNTVSFPDNTFGIHAASKTFFNKAVKDLSLTESAVLVGSLKATYSYNPRVFPEASKLRRNVVLSQMKNYGKLDTELFEETILTDIELEYRSVKPSEGVAPYFREQVRKQLTKWAEDYAKEKGETIDIYSDGLIIHTTLNKKLQMMAEASMKEHMAVLQKAFENNWGNSPPWKKQAIYNAIVQKTDFYKQLVREGKSEAEIQEALRQKNDRETFDWSGTSIKKISLIDSIQNSLKMLQAGFLAMNPADGAIKAWIGGIDFEHFKYDHVAQSKRQVGSTFKPLVYTAALESGVKPCDYFSASSVTYANLEGWTPTNSDTEDYTHINVNMQEAMRKSMNTVSVRLMEESGIAEVLKLAHNAGIKSSLPQVPSLALGTAELSMLELATAYTTFLNNGKPSEPYFITKITNAKGEVLAEFKPAKDTAPAYSEETRQVVLEMMQSVVKSGTASRLGWKYKLTQDIAGKTGTTQNNKDGWFVGLLPNLVTVSWVGADNGAIGFRSTSVGQGANSALPIFGLLMQKVKADKELSKKYNKSFPAPSAKVVRMMDCPPTKEDGFFKKLFTNKDKAKTKNFDEEGKQNKGLFKKLKGIFKKD